MTDYAVIKVIRTPIIASNFLNIHDHPLTVVSAPPAGRIIQVICSFCELTTGSISYTGPTDVGLYYKGTTIPADNIGTNVPFKAGSPSLAVAGPAIQMATKANFAGLALELKSPTANYANGNGTGRVTVYWVESYYL